MAKLNQILAVEKSAKNKAETDFTAAWKQAQRAEPLAGISRTYRPLDELGEKFPDEVSQPQLKAEEIIANVNTALTRLFDLTATKDWANTQAKADVVVDGETLLEGVPATYLLFLEKKLVDLYTFVKDFQRLDPSATWHFDSALNVWATDPVETTKTKKVLRNHVKAEATPQHPAQVEVYSEDVIVGYWTTVKFSGALPAAQASDLLKRVEKLQEAVKFARESANSIDVVDQHIGKPFFDYLFGGQ